MKNRATVLCIRDDTILLVARERARWALPGGRIKRVEPPEAAACRELEEETGLIVSQMSYYFQFQGFSTLHHVFVAEPPADAEPEPLNEIARCRWFTPSKIASLSASVPTRGIVELFIRHVITPAKAAGSDSRDETVCLSSAAALNDRPSEPRF